MPDACGGVRAVEILDDNFATCRHQPFSTDTARRAVSPRVQHSACYFASGSVRSIAISLHICLSVCLSACISQQSHAQTSRNFLYILPVAVARSSSDNNAISYVLPVLWMTSCFHIMGQAWSLRRSELFTVTRQVAPLNCAPGAKSAIFDCLVVYVESYNLYESYELCPHKLSLPVESLKNIVLKT